MTVSGAALTIGVSRYERRRRVQMSADRPDHTADPEQPLSPGFAEGQADPEAFPEDERVGRFSEGQEDLGDEDPEKHIQGRFDEGQEAE